MKLEAADLILVRTPGFFGAAIRFFTRRIGEGPSRCNHVAGVVTAGNAQTADVVEALSNGVVCRKFHQLLGKGRMVEVWRPINLSDEERFKVAAHAAKKVGDKYGWGRVVTAALDWFLFEAVVFRRLCSQEEDCATLWGAAFRSIGRKFGKDSGALTPDCIRDFVKSHPQFYQRII